MKILIRGGKVVDPANRINGPRDVFISNRKIAAVVKPGEPIKGAVAGKVFEIDAKGLVICPGLIDIHVHLREPGYEQKETIETGTSAAVAGGFTSVVCMANTNPVNDNETITEFILSVARRTGHCRVYPIGAVTKGLKGEYLTEMGWLKEAGVVAVSDDGNGIANSALARRALEYAGMFNLPVIVHCEDKDLVGSGVMNSGFVSCELGLPGNPVCAEEVMVARDLVLARVSKGHLHVAHVSTAGSVEMIREAKARGVKVTSEATPHHFTLTEENVRGYDTNCKMAPPLRTEKDRQALIDGLADGTIDAIVTDHAPHEQLQKICEFDKAANGIIGLETALPLTLELVRQKRITLKRAIELLTIGPAKVLGLPGGTLSIGADADVTLFDPKEKWDYILEQIKSRSHNTPWLNQTMTGKVKFTVVNGNVVYRG